MGRSWATEWCHWQLVICPDLAFTTDPNYRLRFHRLRRCVPLHSAHTHRALLLCVWCVCVCSQSINTTDGCVRFGLRRKKSFLLSLFLAFFGCNSNPPDTHHIIIHTQFGWRLGRLCEAVHCHSQLEHPSTQQRCSFQLPRPPEPSRRSPTTLCAAPPAHSVTPSLAALHRQSANPPIRPRSFHRPFLAPPGPAAPVAATQQPHHPRSSATSLFAPVAFRFLLSSALPLAFRLLPANIGTSLQSGPASVETPVPSDASPPTRIPLALSTETGLCTHGHHVRLARENHRRQTRGRAVERENQTEKGGP